MIATTNLILMVATTNLIVIIVTTNLLVIIAATNLIVIIAASNLSVLRLYDPGLQSILYSGSREHAAVIRVTAKGCLSIFRGKNGKCCNLLRNKKKQLWK